MDRAAQSNIPQLDFRELLSASPGSMDRAAQYFPRLNLSELPSASPGSIWVSCPVCPLAWFKWADQYVPRFDLSEFPSASARSIWVGCQVINWKVLPWNIVDNMFRQRHSSWLNKNLFCRFRSKVGQCKPYIRLKFTSLLSILFCDSEKLLLSCPITPSFLYPCPEYSSYTTPWTLSNVKSIN